MLAQESLRAEDGHRPCQSSLLRTAFASEPGIREAISSREWCSISSVASDWSLLRLAAPNSDSNMIPLSWGILRNQA